MIAEIEMGHLATVHHQRAIKQLIYGLERLFQNGQIRLEPLPETDIDPGNPDSKCPDVIFQDNENSTVPIIVEIATSRGWKTDFNKMRRLIEETDFGIEEGFVYNFQLGTWHKFSKMNGASAMPDSWSDILGLDLSKFV